MLMTGLATRVALKEPTKHTYQLQDHLRYPISLNTVVPVALYVFYSGMEMGSTRKSQNFSTSLRPNIDVAMIQETKPTADKRTTRLYGYTPVRAYRPDAQFPGGGLIFYIKYNFAFRKIGQCRSTVHQLAD